MDRHYTWTDLLEAYRTVGVGDYNLIYVTGNFGMIGTPFDGIGRIGILDMHLKALEELVGLGGTIVVPTHSWDLVTYRIPFSPDLTPADYVFSEHVRTHRDCVRQMHPFASVAAYGNLANELIDYGKIYRHAYGADSPFDRMHLAGALHVSVGMPVAKTISAVHHCEVMAQVPYRYTKAFACEIGPFGDDKTFASRECYLNVLYQTDPPLVRDRNRKIMDQINTVRRASIGRGFIESVDLEEFMTTTTLGMLADPYVWLAEEPERKPWIT